MSLPRGKRDVRAAYDQIVTVRTNTKQQAEAAKRAALVGDARPQVFIGLHQFLRTVAPQWELLKDTPGLQQYASNREGDASIDVQAGYDQVRAAETDVIDWLRANLVSDGTGNYAMWRLTAAGDFEPIVYTAEDTSGLVPVLDNLLAVVG